MFLKHDAFVRAMAEVTLKLSWILGVFGIAFVIAMFILLFFNVTVPYAVVTTEDVEVPYVTTTTETKEVPYVAQETYTETVTVPGQTCTDEDYAYDVDELICEKNDDDEAHARFDIQNLESKDGLFKFDIRIELDDADDEVKSYSETIDAKDEITIDWDFDIDSSDDVDDCTLKMTSVPELEVCTGKTEVKRETKIRPVVKYKNETVNVSTVKYKTESKETTRTEYISLWSAIWR